ncbi:MAG TPA: hypothetical protein VF453_07620 [Burkholderiaceae bacterium]
MIVDIPGMRLGRGQNDRENHWARARRVKAEHHAVGWSLAGRPKPALPCVIRITRAAPGNGLDTDNLQGACKAVRDAIAKWIGVDDREVDVVRYEYAQARALWGVRIEVVR